MRLARGAVRTMHEIPLQNFYIKLVDGLSNRDMDDMMRDMRNALADQPLSYFDYRSNMDPIEKANIAITLFFGFTVVVAMAISFFSLMSSMYTNIYEQGKEIGILRALGMSNAAATHSGSTRLITTGLRRNSNGMDATDLHLRGVCTGAVVVDPGSDDWCWCWLDGCRSTCVVHRVAGAVPFPTGIVHGDLCNVDLFRSGVELGTDLVHNAAANRIIDENIVNTPKRQTPNAKRQMPNAKTQMHMHMHMHNRICCICLFCNHYRACLVVQDTRSALSLWFEFSLWLT
jgi:hypothetical protein